MAFPVRVVTVPSSLAGQPNGELPRSILVSTPGQAGGPTVVLVEPAARAWRALCAAAKNAGHVLKISGPASGYRTLAEQVRLFEQRFSTSPTGGVSRTWNGRRYYLRRGMALAAVPGTSNHGRGLAVDTGVELDGDAGTESIDKETLKWLLANEERFGFSHEVQSEAWHIRYFAGDRVPADVLVYERQSKPTPPPIEVLVMAAQAQIIKGNVAAQWFVSDGIHKRPISNTNAGVLALGGIVEWNGGSAFVYAQAAVDNIPLA